MRVRSLLRLLLHMLVPWAIVAGCGKADDAGRDAASSTDDPPANDATAVTPDSAATASGPRVVFVGTSLTAGLGLSTPDEAYPARLQVLADSAGVPARMVNLGVSGETSAGGLRRIGWVVSDTVDVLVLELGANDGLRGQDPDALARNLEAIIDTTRARWPDAEIVLVGMQAPPNLGIRYTRAFHDVFPRVAEERGTALVPFLLEGVGGERALNQGDGIHPTAEGHELIAHNVWPVLEPALLRAAARRSAGPGAP
jgi:acyl-CoA thioesterase-1